MSSCPITSWQTHGATTETVRDFIFLGYKITADASWEICMQVKKQPLELDMEQQTGSKSGKGYVKAVYCCPALFNLYAEYIRRNAGLDEAQAWIKIARRNINNLRYADDTTLMAESEEELKSLFLFFHLFLLVGG